MSVSIYLGRTIILAIFVWVRDAGQGTVQPEAPLHLNLPPFVSNRGLSAVDQFDKLFLDQLTLHDFGVLSAGPCYDIENIALDDGYAKLGSE